MPRPIERNRCLEAKFAGHGELNVMGNDPAVRLVSEVPATVTGSSKSVLPLRKAPLLHQPVLGAPPEHALQDPQVAKIFCHYMENLAAWYDLNDSRRHFKDIVPIRARRNPLLLSAILAFSAANLHRTRGDHIYLKLAEAYHYDSVRSLISLTKNIDQLPFGETLAAVCLLRSYEIITQNVSSQSHLQGCYSLLATRHVHLTADLLSAGYWNYLREDITVALIEHRGLMITLSDQDAPPQPTDDMDFANYITFLLGRVINRCLAVDSPPLDIIEWKALKADIDQWRSALPPSFDTIQTPGLKTRSNFPSIWTLRSWHVSTLHYYHTAMGILWLAQPAAWPLKALQRIDDMDCLRQRLDYHATEICALAISSESASVWVNAFGPVAFCGTWLQSTPRRVELVEEVEKWGNVAGWPVSIITAALSPSSSSSSSSLNTTQ
ncbi:transcriptional regulator family: Fungal Specific TF [Aspergillus niger]|nr:transcriptional regulator family: Fungal Specific TF [Aspergillus niger]KAI2963691.1 transcriptional regulator family: Fungal Specific TF [Aspergillus niger]KAI3016261.1 transcriptional regulator family: Fungal Specific TF [Aspergillus niger]KAI3026921.1 transcriptional regulator family: Fungal Specific TF [Aspergillus niger]KAI3086067.1 transcriptional regulator family: Fungal Specific TF [Aspergillus niger]